MTDWQAPALVEDDDAGALLALLLGGQYDPNRRDPQIGNLVNWTPGLLRRMLQTTQGDPSGLFRVITPLAVATGLQPNDNANSALVVVEGGPIRWRDDGGNPTATVGILTPVGTTMLISGAGSLHGFLAIQTGAAATLTCAFYD